MNRICVLIECSLRLRVDAFSLLFQLEMINISIVTKKQGDVITVSGRLNATSCDEFESAVASKMAEGSRLIILDFSTLDYVSSAGLRTLLGLIKNMKDKEGKLSVVFGEGMVKEVITMSGFDHFLQVYSSVADALNAL